MEPRCLLVVPDCLKSEILEKFHDHSYAGHMGRDDTQHNIKKSFYWYNLYSDVAAYVATCAACSKNKKIDRHKRAGMIQYHAGSPMEHVHLVVLGPFNISSKGNKYVLGMIDQFTKWLECSSTRSVCRKTAISAIDEFFFTLACPSLFILIKVVTLWEIFLNQYVKYLKFKKSDDTLSSGE